jgi:Domain of unknown function (DUF4334)/GXWXG protein
MTRGGAERAARRLAELSAGTTAATALAFFDELPAVDLAGVLGRWRGSGLPTGSPLDGLLEAYGWYGKEFIDPETVHPLLFRDRDGRSAPVSPAGAPVGLLRQRPELARLPGARAAFAAVRPLLRARHPAARLRMLEHRGVLTAAMIYDALPIIDVFRRVDDDTLLGFMDLRGLREPFLFVLRRDAPRVVRP